MGLALSVFTGELDYGLKEGTSVGKYEIVRKIDAGAFGVVYQARNTDLNTYVALKLLMASHSMSEKKRARFRHEAQVQSKLKHSGIVSVLDLIDEEHLAIVMELVDGPSLKEVLQKELTGPWAERPALEFMRPVLAAVDYAHQRQVIHRDLKPGNILLDRTPPAPAPGRPKVTDFGLVKILGDQSMQTQTGFGAGTPPYMAPEQFVNVKSADTRADVFALGMLMWRLLAGRLPVDTSNNMEVARF